MKKFFTIISVALLLIAGFPGCSEYDDSNLQDRVNDLEQKVTALETRVSQMNSEIDAIKILVDALNARKTITGVAETSTGYTVTFNDGSVLTLNHGTNGANGADAPVIGVDEEDGVYYWTLTVDGETSWLLDRQDKKLPVSGVTPVIGVDVEGYWTVNGERITGSESQYVKAKGEDGDSFFSDISHDEDAVTFTLTDGTVIVIPKSENLSIVTDIATALFIRYGETEEYALTLSGTGSMIITKPDGWKVAVRGGKLSVTAPPLENTYAEKDGDISVTVVGKNATVSKTFAVSARDYSHVIDFEEDGIENYLAGPTAYGSNLYDGSSEQYYGYYNVATELYMMINEDIYMGGYNFWSGGIAVSQWNNMETGDYTNQCSVYYSDAITGKGGYKGSNTFAVSNGYNDPTGWAGRSSISFQDDTKECVFDHFYVTNSTYAVLVMKNGGSPATAFSDGSWFKLVVEGIDKSGTATGTVEFYLADFRTPSSPGIITEWTPVDLSPLGSVTAIKFDLQSSDNGTYGMNTPAYFCFDNLAIKK